MKAPAVPGGRSPAKFPRSLQHWPAGGMLTPTALQPRERAVFERRMPARTAPGTPGTDELDPELHTLRQDLAAFQQEEMDALRACLALLLTRAPREEAATAHALHCAARARTRHCLLRLKGWQSGGAASR